MERKLSDMSKDARFVVEQGDLSCLPSVSRQVISPLGLIYASNSLQFREAFFVRDALEVAEDLLDVFPQIASNVAVVLAALQGTTVHDKSEEEPGKIYHEYRSPFLDGHTIAVSSQVVLRGLSRRWGGTDTEVLYYGTVDVTVCASRRALLSEV
jgi:glycogen debranching enzyme